MNKNEIIFIKQYLNLCKEVTSNLLSKLLACDNNAIIDDLDQCSELIKRFNDLSDYEKNYIFAIINGYVILQIDLYFQFNLIPRLSKITFNSIVNGIFTMNLMAEYQPKYRILVSNLISRHPELIDKLEAEEISYR
jgi:hypothetical protein